MAAKRLVFINIVFELLFLSLFCLSFGIENTNYLEEGEGEETRNIENEEKFTEKAEDDIMEASEDNPSSNSLDRKKEHFQNVTTINQENTPNRSSILSHLTEKPKPENDTVKESNDGNNTTNKTAEPLWACKKFNTSQKVVVLSDKNSLIRWLEEINKTMSCAVVLFYAKWCFFSARLAPIYNAAGRAFSGIPILAIDAYTHNSLNTRYGIVGVPTIILFQESKPVARFNRTRTLKDLLEFIHESTGMEYNESIEVSPEDYLGPLSGSPSGEQNYYLIASFLFLLCIGLLCLWRLQYIHMLWNYMPSWPVARRQTAEREKND